jgi:hypothetical protein
LALRIKTSLLHTGTLYAWLQSYCGCINTSNDE